MESRIVCASFWLLAAVVSPAQMSDITGYVKDAAGKPVINAAIQILRQDASRNYQGKTDKHGSYYYQGLPVSFYAVKVVVEGKEVAGVTGLRTQPGAPLEVNFDLGVAPQEQEARIKSSLKKMGAEWSYVKILPVQGSESPIIPAPSAVAAPAKQSPPQMPSSTGSEMAGLFKSGMDSLDAKNYTAAFSRAAEIDSAQPAVWANLAAAYLAVGSKDSGPQADAAIGQALTAYRRALELKPADVATHFNYATALAKARKWDQLRAETTKCAELDPGNAWRTGSANDAYQTFAVATALEKHLKPWLIGKDPDRIEDLWQSANFRTYWRGGLVNNKVVAAMDEALWDIKGKRARMPVYEMLGGRAHDAVACYDHVSGRSKEQAAEVVTRSMENGYRHIRLQYGEGGYGGGGRRPHPGDPRLIRRWRN